MQARKQANSKMQEADQWWEAFDISDAKYRCTMHILLVLEMESDRMVGRGLVDDQYWISLQKQIDACQDWLSVHHDNMQTTATCARSAEIAARIYYEEYEERNG